MDAANMITEVDNAQQGKSRQEAKRNDQDSITVCERRMKTRFSE